MLQPSEINGRQYDLILVGAGISNATIAALYRQRNKNAKILVVERRPHIAGNCYTTKVDNIDVHQYGAHIFHTNNEQVWTFLNQFTKFNDYRHQVQAIGSDGKMYQLPFNMSTFCQASGYPLTVETAENWLKSERVEYDEPANLEEQALALIGSTIYERLIKYYTEKQWGRPCTEIPASVIKRLPVRMNYDSTYFNNAKYQGIPVNGYTAMIENMFAGCDIVHDDYIHNQTFYRLLLKNGGVIFFSGALDELFNYSKGKLDYRSLRFEHSVLESSNYQGTSVVNDCRAEVPYTRTIEHKHFTPEKTSELTVISQEYSVEFDGSENQEPAYPISDARNKDLHKLYRDMAINDGVIPIGRLAEYTYYDMDKAVEAAILKYDEVFNC